MFDFSKSFHDKVFSDKYLFSQELKKLIFRYVDNNEQKSILFQWCLLNFGDKYLDAIYEIFEEDHSLSDEYQVATLLMFLESKT